MSGAHWRGTQLRLAEAKPRFDAKPAASSSSSAPSKAAAADEERRRRKRLRRAVVQVGGKHAQDMRPVTDAARGKFWKLEDGHLVRPICMRPSHPLPPTNRSEVEEKKVARRPMKRMPRRVLDPARWGAAHETFPDETVQREEGWEWESVASDAEQDEEGEDGRILLGHWRRGDERSPVYGRAEGSAEDLYASEATESDFEDGSEASSPMLPARDRSASPLFPTRRDQRSASPLFPTRTADRSPSPLFPSRPAADTGIEAASPPGSPLFPTRTEARSPSPLFPARS